MDLSNNKILITAGPIGIGLLALKCFTLPDQ